MIHGKNGANYNFLLKLGTRNNEQNQFEMKQDEAWYKYRKCFVWLRVLEVNCSLCASARRNLSPDRTKTLKNSALYVEGIQIHF